MLFYVFYYSLFLPSITFSDVILCFYHSITFLLLSFLMLFFVFSFGGWKKSGCLLLDATKKLQFESDGMLLEG